jgi:hypothetical protein
MDKIDLVLKQLEQLARGKSADEDALVLSTRDIFSWAVRLQSSNYSGKQ